MRQPSVHDAHDVVGGFDSSLKVKPCAGAILPEPSEGQRRKRKKVLQCAGRVFDVFFSSHSLPICFPICALRMNPTAICYGARHWNAKSRVFLRGCKSGYALHHPSCARCASSATLRCLRQTPAIPPNRLLTSPSSFILTTRGH